MSDIVDVNDANPTTPVKKFINSKYHREQSEFSKIHGRSPLYRSFSSQPTSKFRVNPYPTNGVCVNNQTFLSSLTSNLARVPDNQSFPRKLITGQHSKEDTVINTWTKNRLDPASILSLSEQNQITRQVNGPDRGSSSSTVLSNVTQSYSPGLVNSLNTYHGQNCITQGLNGQSITHSHHNANHNRLPSTGPSSAVFQLNFPVLKNKSSKGNLSRRQSTESSKDHTVRNAHKKNHQTPTKNTITNIPNSPFRQVISAAVNSSPTVNVAR